MFSHNASFTECRRRREEQKTELQTFTTLSKKKKEKRTTTTIKQQISNLLCGNIEIHILSLPLAEKLEILQVQHGSKEAYMRWRYTRHPALVRSLDLYDVHIHTIPVSQLQWFHTENMFRNSYRVFAFVFSIPPLKNSVNFFNDIKC